MTYRLVYSHGGHELSIPGLATLDSVNDQIRKIYDNEVLPISILRIEEGHDGPRTWAIEYPPAPPAGTRVRAYNGHEVTVNEDGRIEHRGTSYSWKGLLEAYGPLTEVVETEVEAAARRLRDEGFPKRAVNAKQQTYDDMRTIVQEYLNGGQL